LRITTDRAATAASSTETTEIPSSLGLSPVKTNRVERSRERTKTVWTSLPSAPLFFARPVMTKFVEKFSAGGAASGAAVATAKGDFSKRAE
jgi:hypothetical protein